MWAASFNEYSLAASVCLTLKEAERRHEGESSLLAVTSADGSASGEGARPFGGLPSVFGIISGTGDLSMCNVVNVWMGARCGDMVLNLPRKTTRYARISVTACWTCLFSYKFVFSFLLYGMPK